MSAARIGVTTFGGDGGISGISQYIISLLDALVDQPGDERYEVVTYRDERGVFVPDSPRARALERPAWLRPPLQNLAWHQAALPWLCRRRSWDLLFLPAANRRLPWRAPCPTVGTVHDLAGARVVGKYDPARQLYIQRVLPRLIRGLDHVITVSEASRRDIVELTGLAPERVTVTPLAADLTRFTPGDRDAARARVGARLGVPGPYLLYLSRIEHPGKNHVALIRAFDALKARSGLPHRLILAGSDRERADEVHAAAQAARFAEHIHFPGFVAGEDVPDLYRAADLLVFPSLYEGFGLPLVEAMATGTPVAAAAVASIPEVVGDAAQLFDPRDEGAITAAMEHLLTDPAAHDLARARGIARAQAFGWDQAARTTLEVFRRFL